MELLRWVLLVLIVIVAATNGSLTLKCPSWRPIIIDSLSLPHSLNLTLSNQIIQKCVDVCGRRRGFFHIHKGGAKLVCYSRSLPAKLQSVREEWRNGVAVSAECDCEFVPHDRDRNIDLPWSAQGCDGKPYKLKGRGKDRSECMDQCGRGMVFITDIIGFEKWEKMDYDSPYILEWCHHDHDPYSRVFQTFPLDGEVTSQVSTTKYRCMCGTIGEKVISTRVPSISEGIYWLQEDPRSENAIQINETGRAFSHQFRAAPEQPLHRNATLSTSHRVIPSPAPLSLGLDLQRSLTIGTPGFASNQHLTRSTSLALHRNTGTTHSSHRPNPQTTRKYSPTKNPLSYHTRRSTSSESERNRPATDSPPNLQLGLSLTTPASGFTSNQTTFPFTNSTPQAEAPSPTQQTFLFLHPDPPISLTTDGSGPSTQPEALASQEIEQTTDLELNLNLGLSLKTYERGVGTHGAKRSKSPLEPATASKKIQPIKPIPRNQWPEGELPPNIAKRFQ